MKIRDVGKFVLSFPVILIVLWFFPFWGIVLIAARYVIYGEFSYCYLENWGKVPLMLLITATLIYLPKCIVNEINKLEYSVDISLIEKLINTKEYNMFLDFSCRLFILGIMYLLIFYIVRTIFIKTSFLFIREIWKLINQKKESEKDENNV